MDVDAYFRRIGHSGSPTPTLATLRVMHRLHPAAIPFENLTTLLGGSPALDLKSLESKMVRALRGGYCFEHNCLFGGVLRTLGYQVTGLAARVLWERGDEVSGPRTHMLLSVKVAGRTYICDVGFGGLTLTAPLLLEPGIEQATPHECFRLMSGNRGFVLQARLQDQWRSLYWFDLHEHLDVDFEVLNHYVATHPDSPFPSQLFGARALEDRRVGLRNNRLTVYRSDGGVDRKALGTLQELRDVLVSDFNVSLPDDAGLDDALKRVIEMGTLEGVPTR